MSSLLLELNGNPAFNRTIFPPYLYIYDDLLKYKRRKWFIVREITMSYNQIAQATLSSGLLFGTLEIYTTGAEDIIIKYIPRALAKQAKKIIDQKLYHAHAKLHPDKEKSTDDVVAFERSISRLRELVNKGRIDEREFNRRKSDILSKVK